MPAKLQPAHHLATLIAIGIVAGASLLFAAEPVPFPALPAPDADHRAPTLLQRIEPTYPAGVDEPTERRVYVAFLVAADGTVRSASAMFGPPAPFAEAAVQAVNQWKFEPGRLVAGNRPIRTQMTVEFWFKPPSPPKTR
ncbi:MAG: hypothetical protein C0518_07430 [Opitutus sp.]|nr:hypothetical protein [Opitutus sp.]